MNSIPQATCSKCNNTYPLTSEYWHKDKRGRSGFSYNCKECMRAKTREWRKIEGNKERDNANSIAWYHSNQDRVKEYRQTHAERIAHQKRAWRKANPEKTKKHKSDSQLRHRDSANRRHRAYAKRHPDKMRANSRAGWARRRSAVGKYTMEDIKKIYDEQQGYCAYCGIRLFDTYDVDHVMPLSRGGTNELNNLLVACQTCNRSKSNKTVEEWEEVRGW